MITEPQPPAVKWYRKDIGRYQFLQQCLARGARRIDAQLGQVHEAVREPLLAGSHERLLVIGADSVLDAGHRVGVALPGRNDLACRHAP